MEILNLIQQAEKLFNEKNMQAYYAPGRVNLIGEHIDYNGGYVLPCALNIGTIGVASKRDDNLVKCYSENFSELGVISFSSEDLKYEHDHNWANYVKAIMDEMGVNSGFNLYVKGDIPNRSGLSSSASLEVLVGVILNDLFNLGFTNLEIAKIGQRAENDFIGVKCGIMDQFVISMAKAQSAILLKTSDLDYHYVDIDFKDYTLIIANTNKKRTLSTSKYNERREECERGLAMLNKKFNLRYLCDLDYKTFLENTDLITDEVILKRVRHVISENQRTIDAYKALQSHDLIKFGKLLVESHQSLKNDYEVTGLELDTMTNLFMINHALGARMTGAGFGGCAIALVKNFDVNKVIEKVKKSYKELTNIDADFYIVSIGRGAHKYEY